MSKNKCDWCNIPLRVILEYPQSAHPPRLDSIRFSFIPTATEGTHVDYSQDIWPAAALANGRLAFTAFTSDCICIYTILLINRTLTTTISYISGNSSTLPTLRKFVISVWTYFHYFDIKSTAKEDFIFVFLGRMARHHVLIDVINRLYEEYHITVKTNK